MMSMKANELLWKSGTLPCHAPVSRYCGTLPWHAPVSRSRGTLPCHAPVSRSRGTLPWHAPVARSRVTQPVAQANVTKPETLMENTFTKAVYG